MCAKQFTTGKVKLYVTGAKMAPLRKEKFYIHSFPLAAREKRHTHPLGADHHKDDISVDFDRVGCQILDDSIAVGGGETETIHFLLGRFSAIITE